jgi:hypothetical protein
MSGAVAQLVRASACHAEGREFESRQLRQSSLNRAFRARQATPGTASFVKGIRSK